jgi:hypothetical protein
MGDDKDDDKGLSREQKQKLEEGTAELATEQMRCACGQFRGHRGPCNNTIGGL